MRHFAPRYGGDPRSGARSPGARPGLRSASGRALPAHAWPAGSGWLAGALIRAVLSHGWGTCTDVEPLSEMERVLFAVDELTGLIAATALVRPSRSVLDTTVASVRKKWKTARFAAGVDRALIERGAERLGVSLDDLIAETLAGMQPAAAALGLAGNPSATGAEA